MNEAVFLKFEEFRNYIFVKNQKFKRIRELISKEEYADFILSHEAYLVRYYAKELRFVIKDDLVNKISVELSNLMVPLNRSAVE